MYEAIVVGTDGSESAHHAVARAAELARSCGATLHVVTAIRMPAAATTGFDPGIGVYVGEALADAEREAGLAVQKILEDTAAPYREQGLTVETHLATGDPADVLIDVAEKASPALIVVGNRGMSGAKRFLLGSVPNKVSHHAHCDVLIVKTT